MKYLTTAMTAAFVAMIISAGCKMPPIGSASESGAIPPDLELSPILEDAFAPVEVGVPPGIAARDLCLLDNGEIRHYGRKLVKELAYTGENPAPLSYLHLQTLAEDTDPEGTYFKSFRMMTDGSVAR